jgi:uncharacterized membrane protein
MLPAIIANSETGATFLLWVEYATLFIEALAVLIIVVAIVVALTRYLLRYADQQSDKEELYHGLKVSLGKALLLGLEVLVAADIIHTVALEATLESVLVLGLLVVIRTFLSWALLVEIEGRWPWQHA